MARPAFRGGTVHARVPATSANLGPGFDSLGLALTLHDDVVARVADEGLLVDVAGEGEDVARDEQHLVVRAMRTAFDRLGGQPNGLELSCANRIPHGRGLGSSAAAIVAGILLARAVTVGGEERLPDGEVLALATEIEGHPDNVAACLLGGLTVAWVDDTDNSGPGAGRSGAKAVRLHCDPRIHPVVFIPPFESSTEQARARLPGSVPHRDAAFSAGRSALMVAALTTAPHALLAASDDRLHQPYRASGMRASADLVAALRADGVGAVISGAGPTVLAFAVDSSREDAVRGRCPSGWRCAQLPVADRGARIVPREHAG
ncbi:MAG: homoserine kinase [Actinomycetota bacterium]|nr:homoserine kinase [Actinomycetota bacterium]